MSLSTLLQNVDAVTDFFKLQWNPINPVTNRPKKIYPNSFVRAVAMIKGFIK